jgi:hypothetical protein
MVPYLKLEFRVEGTRWTFAIQALHLFGCGVWKVSGVCWVELRSKFSGVPGLDDIDNPRIVGV